MRALSVAISAAMCISAAHASVVRTIAAQTQAMQDAQVHQSGQLWIQGWVQRNEVFRASFGASMPCGQLPALLPQHPSNGCDSQAYMPGKVAFVLRGECTFLEKARAAVAAGAVGLVLINTEPGLIRAPAPATEDVSDVSIPVVMMKAAAFAAINQSLPYDVETSVMLTPHVGTCTGEHGQPDTAAHHTQLEETEVAMLNVYNAQGGLAFHALAGTASFGGPLLGARLQLSVASPELACTPLEGQHKETYVISACGACTKLACT